MNKHQLAIMKEVAIGKTYESEYDGRMYTHCVYCEADMNIHDHDSDCLMLQAREALGLHWQAHLDEIQRQRDVAQEEAERAENNKRGGAIIECDICQARVRRKGIVAHKRDSVRCNQKRTGIKCITTKVPKQPVDNPCKECGKEMGKDAHPNKKFCSNSGRGNCKDRYYNKQPGRIQQFRERFGTEEGEELFVGPEGR